MSIGGIMRNRGGPNFWQKPTRSLEKCSYYRDVVMREKPHFRAASESDLDRLIDIHFRAFPDPRGEVERLRNFRDNRFGPLSRLVVGEVAGSVVAHAFLFDFELGCRGVVLPVAGVASVGVAPEARGQGVGTALVHHLHDEARSRGKVASLLFPFREGFYARLGYGKTTPTIALECAPRTFSSLEGNASVRAAKGSDREHIVSFYTTRVSEGLGRIERSDATWNKFFADPKRYLLVAERDGAFAGYAMLGFDQNESHAAITLYVHELLAIDAAAERSLLAVVGAQRSNVLEVRLDVPYGSYLPQALVDMDALRFGTERQEHTVGKLLAGPMVRVLDFESLLRSRPLAGTGSFSFYVAEEDATYTLSHTANGRTCNVERGERTKALLTPIAAASSLLLGGVSAFALAAAGLCRGDQQSLTAAAAVLGQDVFFGCDAF